MTWDVLGDAFKAGGFSLVLFIIGVFAIWQVWLSSLKRESSGLVRENAMGKRIDDLQKQTISLMSGVVAKNTEALNGNSDALHHKARVDAEILAALHARPCLVETNKHPVIKTPLPSPDYRR